MYFCVFFFNDPATTEIYTLSLHDALPIFRPGRCSAAGMPNESQAQLAIYLVSSTITTCWVGTPENGGAIRTVTPSGPNTKTRLALNLTQTSIILLSSAPTRPRATYSASLCLATP